MQDHPKVPKYWKLAEEVRGQLRSGAWRAGDQLPSLAEMQARSRVSRATVEKVYSLLEQEGLITRRQGAGTFVTDGPPPAPRTGTRLPRTDEAGTGLIGFVGRAFASRRLYHASADIAAGVEEALLGTERRLLLLDAGSPAGWDKVDGVLLDVPYDAEHALRFLPAGLPCVSLLVEAPGASSVVADDFGGAKQAVEHLLELGHRRIACLMEAEPTLSRLRLAGYYAALAEANIKVLPAWAPSPRVPFDVEAGYRRWARRNMEGWLRSGWGEAGCTALLAQNDMAAIGVIEALQGAGFDVPGDVSVMGFDGTLVCECVTPCVTAVEVPLREMALQGTRLLLQHIGQGEWQNQALTLPTHLQVRGSTSAPATDHPFVKHPAKREQLARAGRYRKAMLDGATLDEHRNDRTALLGLLEGVS